MVEFPLLQSMNKHLKKWLEALRHRNKPGLSQSMCPKNDENLAPKIKAANFYWNNQVANLKAKFKW